MSIEAVIEKKLEEYTLRVQFSGEDEVIALLGASGSGKSMILKCIAGVERPDRGRIVINERVLFDSEKGINLPPQKRRVGLLFQNYALFPQRTVLQNVTWGALWEKDTTKREQKILTILEQFELLSIKDQKVELLSGGQQQRTALARVLVSEPDILLLDEPFAALDSHLRFRLEQELGERLRRFGRTVLFVSHDRDEVYRLCDKIAVLHRGQVDAFGEKKEVFRSPVTRNGAILTGCKNVSDGLVTEAGHVLAEDWGMELLVPTEKLEAFRGVKECAVGIRMHGIRAVESMQSEQALSGQPDGQPGQRTEQPPMHSVNCFRCRVLGEMENPFSITVFLQCEESGKGSFGWEVTKEYWAQNRADKVYVCLPPEEILVLRA